jgi:hypothetical protein
VLAIAVLSCDVSYLLPTTAAGPTLEALGIDTVIAGTAGAAQTQTAELLPPSATPSLTPTPTRTPLPPATSTATFIFFLRSPVPTRTLTPVGGGSSGSGGYACVLSSQKPTDGTGFKPNAKFDMVWTLQNSGGNTWLADETDFEYSSGKKMQSQDAYGLPRDVLPGESISMTVKMNAPKVDGEHKTVWILRSGGTYFCRVDVTIVVE